MRGRCVCCAFVDGFSYALYVLPLLSYALYSASQTQSLLIIYLMLSNANSHAGVFMALIIAGNLVAHWVTRVVHSRRHHRRHPYGDEEDYDAYAFNTPITDGVNNNNANNFNNKNKNSTSSNVFQPPGVDVIANMGVAKDGKGGGKDGGGDGGGGNGSGSGSRPGRDEPLPPCELALFVIIGLVTSPLGVVIEVRGEREGRLCARAQWKNFHHQNVRRARAGGREGAPCATVVVHACVSHRDGWCACACSRNSILCRSPHLLPRA